MIVQEYKVGVEVQTLLIEMERWIGILNFEKYTAKSIDLNFEKEVYFGNYYVLAPHDEILQRAFQNDIELKVLELIQKTNLKKTVS